MSIYMHILHMHRHQPNTQIPPTTLHLQMQVYTVYTALVAVAAAAAAAQHSQEIGVPK